MTVLAANRAEVLPIESAAPPTQLMERLLSLDVFRGIIMVSLISFGFGFRALKDDPRWSFLARQVDHPAWTGTVFWDLIQPAFMFMVGVAMPFAFARRRAMGATRQQLLLHTLRRALGLIVLGILITCITDGKISIEFRRVLQQIAVGYVISFFLLERGYLTQFIAAASILILYTLAWIFYAHHAGVDPWIMGDANMGGAFERLVFRHNSTGHYVSLNSIPATATILFGVICGQLVGSNLPKSRVITYLAIFGASAIALGLALDPFVPIIKRIWTASFTLYSAGFVILALLLFYWMIEVMNWRRGWTFFIVVGMNSIFAYAMTEIFRGWFNRSVLIFSKPFFTLLLDHQHVREALQKPTSFPWPAQLGAWGEVIQAILVLLAQWAVLYFLYRRRLFFKL
jgi:predicted acyltransferase